MRDQAALAAVADLERLLTLPTSETNTNTNTITNTLQPPSPSSIPRLFMEMSDLSGSPLLLFCTEADYLSHNHLHCSPSSLLFPDFSHWNLGDLHADDVKSCRDRDDRFYALQHHAHKLIDNDSTRFSPSITYRHEGVHCGYKTLDIAAPGLELNLGVDAHYSTDLPVQVAVEGEGEEGNGKGDRRSFVKERSKKISHGGKLEHLRGSGKAFGTHGEATSLQQEPVDMAKLRTSLLALREDATETDLNDWLLTSPARMDIDIDINIDITNNMDIDVNRTKPPIEIDTTDIHAQRSTWIGGEEQNSPARKTEEEGERDQRNVAAANDDNERDDRRDDDGERRRYASPTLVTIAESLNAYTYADSHPSSKAKHGQTEAEEGDGGGEGEGEEMVGARTEDDPSGSGIFLAEDVQALTSAAEMSMESIEQEVLKLTQETARFLTDGVLPSRFKSTSTSSSGASSSLSKWVSVATHEDMRNFSTMIPRLALKVPFELDDFQKRAVVHLERGESVFIGAHTSAGKTVVAEYAIALALQHRTRVVYTSPIKALSNQKFRDFQHKFGSDNVGLITGDVSLNPSAACLVMTTEILRSMLYRGADLVRDIEWVVFDEVHYINDVDRGVVWEEVIIMLPEEVGLIFLSATTPNTQEFSSWIGRTKRQHVYVITTDKRPVPLQHYLFSADKFHMVKDAKGQFLTAGYNAAKKAKSDTNKPNKSIATRGRGRARGRASGRGRGGGGNGRSNWRANEKATSEYWSKLVRRLDADKLTPTVVFTFSKKKCDERAGSLTTVDLTSPAEKSRIHVTFRRSLARLSPLDRALPQVVRIEALCKKGLAVHHGGLLPILKEIVEILFARGLIKVLFATETFAIGVNMPARAVVFNGLRKHDGTAFRDLLPGEYTQMSGRAGRRGLDSVGTVILAMPQEPPPLESLTTMLVGKATKLQSRFRLTYNLILNLLRVAELSVAEMIKRSFSEFAAQKMMGKDLTTLIADGEAKLAELRKRLADPCVFGGDSEIQLFQRQVDQLLTNLAHLLHEILSGAFGPKPAKKLLAEGRVVLVVATMDDLIFQPCRVLAGGQGSHVLVEAADGKQTQVPLHGILVVTKRMASSRMELNNILAMAKLSTQSSADIEDHPNYANGYAWLAEECIDPLPDLQINELDFVTHWREYSKELKQLSGRKCMTCTLQPSLYVQYERVNGLAKTIHKAKLAMSDENLALFPDFQSRLHVLEDLRYIQPLDSTVGLKGRVSSEINTCEELILTEIIFENILGDLDPAECAALLSALVVQAKINDAPTLTPRLQEAQRKVLTIATKLEDLQQLHRVEIDADWVQKSLNFGLMEVVYEWARGVPFSEICQLTTVEEGTIVRCITRLDETCREVRTIAKVIGDAPLFKKMQQASTTIKRDIIFATSLYIS